MPDPNLGDSHADTSANTNPTGLYVAAAIAFAGVGVFFVLNHFIGPKFAQIFFDLKVDLPLPTRVTLAIVDLGPIVAIVLLGVFALLVYLRSAKFMVLFILFLSVTLTLEALSIYLPIVKIQEALRKK